MKFLRDNQSRGDILPLNAHLRVKTVNSGSIYRPDYRFEHSRDWRLSKKQRHHSPWLSTGQSTAYPVLPLTVILWSIVLERHG